MRLLGERLRQRRRQMHLGQSLVAGPNTASFLSKVENGVAQPSLANLQTWSQKLETTMGDLLGDHLVLEAAKECILVTEKCHRYLDQLPEDRVTAFLRELSLSATSLSMTVPQSPTCPELEYLTATVLLHRGMFQEAKDLVEHALASPYPIFWQIYHLSLLCRIYAELSDPVQRKQTEDRLRQILGELDHQELINCLPEGGMLTLKELDLLKLSMFCKQVL